MPNSDTMTPFDIIRTARLLWVLSPHSTRLQPIRPALAWNRAFRQHDSESIVTISIESRYTVNFRDSNVSRCALGTRPPAPQPCNLWPRSLSSQAAVHLVNRAVGHHGKNAALQIIRRMECLQDLVLGVDVDRRVVGHAKDARVSVQVLVQRKLEHGRAALAVYGLSSVT